MPSHGTIYALAPGFDVVRVADDRVLLRSDTSTVRLDGEAAAFFAERVLPLLDGARTVAEVEELLPDVSGDDVREHLASLEAARVLRVRAPDDEEVDAIPEPFARMLEALGLSRSESARALADASVAIVGLEAVGAELAVSLGRLGIGSLRLLDPFTAEEGDRVSTAHAASVERGHDRAAGRREDVAAALVHRVGGRTLVTTSGGTALEEAVARATAESDLVVGCFDRGFLAASHWINRAALEHRTPALYVELRAHRVLLGPLFVPAQTACFMCYRMRAVACEDDFREAMAYEEHLHRSRVPIGHERPVLPPLAGHAASLAAIEALKVMLPLGSPTLAGRVLEYDSLSIRSQIHTVIRRADCPMCGKKEGWLREQPAEFLADETPPFDGGLEHVLVSPLTGVVRALEQIRKDADEPALPVVLRADLANHRFLVGEEREQASHASGKGLTRAQALASTLGEAVERYSAGSWTPAEVAHAAVAELDGPFLDPRRLVLYTAEQYERLPYAPYTPETRIGWAVARSLGTGEAVYVPALAVFLNYEVHSHEEMLCPTTSNGLAAGASLGGAVASAALEVVERDAFMVTWLNRLPTERVDAFTHPDRDVQALLEAYRRRGVEVALFRLPTDTCVSVFLALALANGRRGDPAVVGGLGAGFARAPAARKAILETAQIRPALRRRLRDVETQARLAALVADRANVEKLEDHDLLYASESARDAFDFLLDSTPDELDWTAGEASLGRLVDDLAEAGSDLLYVNLTPPEMGALGLFTARAILPDFQPIDFGHRERRLGGERLYALPARLGFREARTHLGNLNPDPHPLS